MPDTHVVISLLRGVNVGGHNQIRMEALRALYESLGLSNPKTHVQSGNVIFLTRQSELSKLSEDIRNGIGKAFGFRPEIILRTMADFRKVVSKNPFSKKSALEPSKLLITFLAAEPASDVRQKLLETQTDGEEMRIIGRELYTYFPNGMGRSRFSGAFVEKTLKTVGTGRNLNTVTKMLEIAQDLEKTATAD